MITFSTKNPKPSSPGSDRQTADEIWVCLDPYDLDGITIEEADGIVLVSHVVGAERVLIYSAPLQEP